MSFYFTFLVAAVAAAVTSMVLEVIWDEGQGFELGGALGMIDRVSNLSLEDFNRRYNGKWPVIITDVVGMWKASGWDQSFFLENFPEEHVTMKSVQGKLKDATSSVTTLEQFARMKKSAGRPRKWLYIEDEIFIPQRPGLREDIGQVIYIDEDFFHLFPEEIKPWNAMLLWGTAYSRSSLHIDPYNWTGTNAVLFGRKRWKLYPPGQDKFLYATANPNSGFPLNCHKYGSPVDAFDPDLENYPNFAKARGLQVEQKPGELLIIPSGWFHQAFNVRETLAISSQVMNSANFRIVLEEIAKAGNFPNSRVPELSEDLSPLEQVRELMQRIPQHVIDRGRALIDTVVTQLGGQSSMPEACSA